MKQKPARRLVEVRVGVHHECNGDERKRGKNQITKIHHFTTTNSPERNYAWPYNIHSVLIKYTLYKSEDFCSAFLRDLCLGYAVNMRVQAQECSTGLTGQMVFPLFKYKASLYFAATLLLHHWSKRDHMLCKNACCLFFFYDCLFKFKLICKRQCKWMFIATLQK